MTVLASSGCLWTVWDDDNDAEPLHEVPTRTEAEELLLRRPDHDYTYIQSPDGEQYAWNCFRETWERVTPERPLQRDADVPSQDTSCPLAVDVTAWALER